MPRRQWTQGEAETKRLQAIEFMERIGGDAGKFEDMTAAEYAESRGSELLANPSRKRKSMARNITAGPTKAELAESLEDVAELLEEALDAELTREEVIAKLKDALDLASGEEPEEDEGGFEDDDEEE